MLKILQARLQQCLNWELPDVQAGFIYLFIYFLFYFIFKLYIIVLVKLDLEKTEEPEIKLPKSNGS